MNWLIIPKEGKPFLTKWFDYENHFTEGMIIFDLSNMTYSTDGKVFCEVEEDHL